MKALVVTKQTVLVVSRSQTLTRKAGECLVILALRPIGSRISGGDN